MYRQLKQISAQLIRQFGLSCVIKTEKSGKYNPETGGVSKKSTVENNAYCLFDNLAYDFPSYQSSGSGKGDSAMVKQGDVMLYITAEGKPEVLSKVFVDDETWSIIKCQSIKPAGTALLYQCQARRISNGGV
ncbi:hypothetical protein [Rodentibacter haemolyticus]|uniref:Phage tail protein n=1 Tax=Rodentibacter haemolyticus TaxID=2778911 RepID=A0ABX6UWD2_9PAST|nr:hypothetical protein [Rodentibacter haemolyticus]QPB42223.1 hypothetical protein IHV77_09970 [Rodentibacter haemolyticus]